ncbi:peptidoglycan editing factor PgeF [Alphaproteobacteria bacterium]|nr:peptidoglycan editing factor PgeF [Alphaproteobacteria bacterium]
MTATMPINLEGGPQCYQHAGWQDSAARKWNIRHGFFTANGGVSTGFYQSLNCGFGSNDDPALIAENRRRVANSLGFQPDQVFGLRQTHSARVVTIDSTSDASIDARADADALVTNNSGYALAILTADCVPVLFAAPEMGVIGAAHAGWRGAVDGVLEATIAMMAKQGITPDQIEAVIGPAIQQANYQVGDDLRHAVLATHDDAEVFFDPDQDKDRKYRFDLSGFVQSRLRKAGLDKVTDLGIDTYGESSGLFSHRHATHAALPDSGRQISVIGLVQNPTPKMT